MIQPKISLRIFRLVLFPILMLIEGTLVGLFLGGSFYRIDTPYSVTSGWGIVWGWLLAGFGFLVIVGLLLLFLTSFGYKNAKISNFFTNERMIRILSFITIGILYIQIVLLAITQIFYTFLQRNYTTIYLIIMGLSLIIPVLLVFIGNFEISKEIPYSLSPETPLRIQITTLWLAFLAGAMQIIAFDWSFIVIGILVILMTVYFFFLSRYAAIVIPSILIIHSVFSIVIAIVSFINKEEFMQEIISTGSSITDFQVYAIIIGIFIIPGLFSAILAQSFFRKWVLKWIREVRPEPKMEIELEFAD